MSLLSLALLFSLRLPYLFQLRFHLSLHYCLFLPHIGLYAHIRVSRWEFVLHADFHDAVRYALVYATSRCTALRTFLSFSVSYTGRPILQRICNYWGEYSPVYCRKRSEFKIPWDLANLPSLLKNDPTLFFKYLQCDSTRILLFQTPRYLTESLNLIFVSPNLPMDGLLLKFTLLFLFFDLLFWRVPLCLSISFLTSRFWARLPQSFARRFEV